MDYSLHLYGEVRQHLRAVLQECAAAGRRVAIYGRGEAAELAYLSLKESGLEPVAIFDDDGGHEFLGMPVLPIAEHAEVEYDLMIVATLERSGSSWPTLLERRRAARQAVPAAPGTGAARAPAPERGSQRRTRSATASTLRLIDHGTDEQAHLHHRRRRLHRLAPGRSGCIEDNEVVVYDNLHRNALQFAHLDGHPHLHFIKGDVLDYDGDAHGRSTAARSSSTAPRSPASTPSIAAR